MTRPMLPFQPALAKCHVLCASHKGQRGRRLHNNITNLLRMSIALADMYLNLQFFSNPFVRCCSVPTGLLTTGTTAY